MTSSERCELGGPGTAAAVLMAQAGGAVGRSLVMRWCMVRGGNLEIRVTFDAA